MPVSNAVCIGCQWEQEDFTLLTAPGNDIFLVHPNVTAPNTIELSNKKITLTPHGCGVMLKNRSDTIKYLDDGILIGNKHFKKGESINIGNDVTVRTKGMNSTSVKQHIDTILEKCPGTIYGQMHQLFARTKYGDLIILKEL